jgi:hypothetical protein
MKNKKEKKSIALRRACGSLRFFTAEKSGEGGGRVKERE